MKLNNKVLFICIAALSVSLLTIIGVLIVRKFGPTSQERVGNGSTLEIAQYPDTIGTVDSPASLTTAYANTSSVKTSGGMANMVIAGTYTPRAFGSQLYISMERSIDKGVSYFPYTTLTTQADGVLVNTSGSSTTKGSPFTVPGNNQNLAASGTPIKFSWDMTVAADFIRFVVKEVSTTTLVTSTLGTLNLQSYFTSN